MLYHTASPYFKAYLASTRMYKAKEQAKETEENKKEGEEQQQK